MKSLIWTSRNVDGFCGYMLIKWALPKAEFEHMASTSMMFREDFLRWSLKNKLSDYKYIFFIGLDVNSSFDLIDHKGVISFYHRKPHKEMCLQNAVSYADESVSSSIKVYKFCRDKFMAEYTDEQKTLLIYANDIESDTRELKESRILDAIFKLSRNKFAEFETLHKNGFSGFTTHQLNLYRLYAAAFDEHVKTLDLFIGENIPIGDGMYSVAAAFSSTYIDEVSRFILMKNPDVDAVIIVNSPQKRVHFRKSKKSKIDLVGLSRVIADGGGYNNTAGGKLNETFIEFTKLLKPAGKVVKEN